MFVRRQEIGVHLDEAEESDSGGSESTQAEPPPPTEDKKEENLSEDSVIGEMIPPDPDTAEGSY